MEITQLDEAGLALIKQFEGCILHPYKDQVGIPTIGIGMTYYPTTGRKVSMNDPSLTLAVAEADFLLLVKPFELAVYSTTRDDLTQNQFNALVSLTYNIGTGGFKGSTVHRLVNANVTGAQLKAAFLMWDKADGKPLEDLVERRTKEYEVYSQS
jgi:lysozyme